MQTSAAKTKKQKGKTDEDEGGQHGIGKAQKYLPVIVVSGASSGIGAAVAVRYASTMPCRLANVLLTSYSGFVILRLS